MTTLSGTLLTLPLLLLLTGCGDDAPNTTSPATSASPLVVTTDAVRFEVPAGWRTLDPDVGESALADAAEEMGSTPELMARQLGEIDVMAAAPAPDQGFLDNVNVTHAPLPLPTADHVRNQLSALGVDRAGVTTKETALGPAIAASYVMETAHATVHGAALTLATADEVVTITVSTDQAEETRALAKEVLASLSSPS